MYIKSLSIRNMRAFHEAGIEFRVPSRRRVRSEPRLTNVTVLLGINGSGKSTILDAVALALLSPLIGSSGYRPYVLIRRSSRGEVREATIKANIELNEQDLQSGSIRRRDTLALGATIRRRGSVELIEPEGDSDHRLEPLYYEESPAFFIAGYGAMRRVDQDGSRFDSPSRQKLRGPRYERVASLFEDHYALSPLNGWLPEWQMRDPRRFSEVVSLIGRLLPKGLKFTGDMEGGEFVFHAHGVAIPFGALSDGYRAYLGWISDLLSHMCVACSLDMSLLDCEGVVMVDEIDLHIHPEWQRTIVPQIARTLPHLQFIFTTHSPLVVGSLEKENIWLVARRGRQPALSRPDEEVYGLSADQILRSDLFGLSSTRNPAFSSELAALAKRIERGEPGAASLYMRKTARGEDAIEVQPETADLRSVPEWLRKIAGR